MKPNDTIAAIATARGQAGIGIIRMSGPKAPMILESLWQGVVPCTEFESHKLYRGGIKAASDGPILDQAVACWMKAPRSYTGEDVVEVHAHGSSYLLERILASLVQQGAQLAEAGEFTQRAFLNGKIDLTQAEAVADMIESRNEQTMTLATRHLTGKLSSNINKLKERLLEIRVALEGDIDFVEEEDVKALDSESLSSHLIQAHDLVTQWLSTFEEGRLWREGIQCALVGRPNVGKSSLLNALLGQDRALVHNLPGTTRDTVEETLLLSGLPVRFIDTAGLHASKEPVEQAGQQRSRQKIQEGDLCLWVLDGSQPLTQEDLAIFQDLKDQPFHLIVNKADLGLQLDLDLLHKEFHPLACHVTSATRGEGVGELKLGIKKWATHEGNALQAEVTINNERHRLALQRCAEALLGAREGLQQKMNLDLIASDLLLATRALGEITGEITTDDILTEVFSRFCVGK
jgi:tRNA modification GTPase